jgi:ubiquinone/menaquinone biosynthesis C-methylase UbiE
MTVGYKIKYCRTKKGLTQEELAYKANVGVKTIQRAEKNIQISIDALKSIANILEIDYDYLLDDRKHIAEIKREFSNQAQSLNNSPIFNNNDIIDTIISLADIKPDSNVLDLACGTGIVTKALAKTSKHIYAVDITDEMIKMTKAMCIKNGFDHVKVLKGNAEKLNFDNEYFDIIVTRLSIHHFMNPDLTIKEMKRVLKPNGTILISDIYSSNDTEDAELHNAIEILRDPTHIKMLSLSEFEKLFSSNNLAITETSFINIEREYDEWLTITNAPERYQSLYIILKNLIKCGMTADIDLKYEDNKIYFLHKWVIYKLVKTNL